MEKNKAKKNKVLIIRFSSFGDIVQASTVVELISHGLDSPTIHWVTRSEFENLVALNTDIAKVFTVEKVLGIKGLIRKALELRKENYTHIYDAHNNLRSRILRIFLLTRFSPPRFTVRSKDRLKRILLFYFRINLFPKPFKGIESYISPLIKWGIPNAYSKLPVVWNFNEKKLKTTQYLPTTKFISIIPSAAWEMKRWPVEFWKKLILLLPNVNIVILGGKEDIFCKDISAVDSLRVFNLAGKLSLIESCDVIRKSALIISADTGLLHVADVLGIQGISLMGPTAFGFTSSDSIRTMETELSCRPCSKDGRGRCSQAIYQQCMVDITPEQVASVILKNYFLS
jgi:heptosyltransferase-2